MTATPRPSGLTPKGVRTRARIVDAAVALVRQHGVADTTVGQIRADANVSSSQLYHYFPDKDALIRAVVDRVTDMTLTDQERLDLATPDGLRAWRDGLITHAHAVSGRGGSALGHLIGQLVETDEAARVRLADGFDRWARSLRAAMHRLADAGHLRPGIDPDRLGDALLAALQGGLLLSQVHRSEVPLDTALTYVLDTALPSPPP